MRKLLLLSLFLSGLVFVQAQEKKGKDIKPLAIDSKAIDFDLPGVDGKNYSLKDFEKYDILAIVFTCNHCPTAQAYEEKLIKAVEKYEPQGVGFVAISPNNPEAISLSELGYSDLGDDLDDMKVRAKNMNYNFTYLYDGESQKTSIAYGPATTPQVFIFDKSRTLKYRGRLDDTENPYVAPKSNDLYASLDAMISDKNPPVASTKSFGCSIKWAWKNEWTKKELGIWAKEPVSIKEIDLEGMKEVIANKGDKLILVNFWATWCGPCIQEFPELVSINRMYRGRDFEFISVSTDKIGKKEKVTELLKKKEASNTNYIYTEDIYDLIEVVDKDWQGSLPYTAIIEPGGKVIYKIEGTIEPQEVKSKIVDHLGRYYADDN